MIAQPAGQRGQPPVIGLTAPYGPLDYSAAALADGVENAQRLPRVHALADIVVARTGIFLHSERRGVNQLLLPIQQTPPLPGLTYDLEPVLQLSYPKAPAELLGEALLLAQDAATGKQGPLEVLFTFCYDEEQGTWSLVMPEQVQRYATVEASMAVRSEAFCELHSHHHMGAFFSETDDRDEQEFRFYAVLGTVMTRPTLLVRVGLLGYHWILPATHLFTSLPGSIRDGYLSKRRLGSRSVHPHPRVGLASASHGSASPAPGNNTVDGALLALPAPSASAQRNVSQCGLATHWLAANFKNVENVWQHVMHVRSERKEGDEGNEGDESND
jgi:PRTRC genetic system protein A